jgi:AcrR family transcriptional regulator
VPQLIDTSDRVGTLVVAMNELTATEGIPGLTLRKIAAVSRVSTGSIIHHLGGKARLLSLGAGLTGRALHTSISDARWSVGALGFLPGGEDELLLTRAWLGWAELGRSDPVVEVQVTQARREERALLAEILDYRLEREELDLLTALIAGLREALCQPTRPLPPARARTLLARQLDRLGVPVTPSDGEWP